MKTLVINSINQNSKEQNNTDTNIVYLKLPFIKELDKKTDITIKSINKLLSPKTLIRVAYNTHKTSFFFPNKDKVASDLFSNVVYQYNCTECNNKIYTGETSRHFYTRQKEHLSGKPVPSEISLHQHERKKENFKIILRTSYTKIGEAVVNNFVSLQNRMNNYKPPFELKICPEIVN